MIRKVKNWLGIESVKIELILPPEVPYGKNILKGVMLLTSPSNQTIRGAHVRFIEKFERGKQDEKRINDFLLGEWKFERELEVPADEKVFIPFKIPLRWKYSDIDLWSQKNIFNAGIAKLAKRFHGVQSVYRIEGSIQVDGAKLQPFYKAEMDVIDP